jgi:hypothetical protein
MNGIHKDCGRWMAVCRPQLLASAAQLKVLPTIEQELSYVWPCKQVYPRDSQELFEAVAEYKLAAQNLVGHDSLLDPPNQLQGQHCKYSCPPVAPSRCVGQGMVHARSYETCGLLSFVSGQQ